MENIIAQRNLALDVLRGISVALMILVNIPGDSQNTYAIFTHAHWHGFTLADFVFPTFLFVVGNSMAYSFRKYCDGDQALIFGKVFRRASILFGLGLLLNYFPFFRFENAIWIPVNPLDIRFWGVLQRIAVCYMLASILVFRLRNRYLVIFCISVLVGYWLVLRIFSTTPDPYAFEVLGSNPAARIDLMFLPVKNIYKGYGTPFDPEGLLSTLPAVVNVIAGYMTAKMMKSISAILASWGFAACGIGFLGFALAIESFSPINKPLWTSTYVIFSTGWDLIVLSAIIIAIEIFGLRRWTYFFDVLGRNSIVLYVMSFVGIYLLAIFTDMDLVFSRVFFGDAFVVFFGAKNSSFIFSIFYLMAFWVMAWVLNLKKIYIKI